MIDDAELAAIRARDEQHAKLRVVDIPHQQTAHDRRTLLRRLHDMTVALEKEKEYATGILTGCLEGESALKKTHVALGGDGKFTYRPNKEPPDSGNLKLDVPALAAKIMAERDSALNQGLGFSTVMNEMKTEFAKVSARLDAMTAERDAAIEAGGRTAAMLAKADAELIEARAHAERLWQALIDIEEISHREGNEFWGALYKCGATARRALAATAPPGEGT